MQREDKNFPHTVLWAHFISFIMLCKDRLATKTYSTDVFLSVHPFALARCSLCTCIVTKHEGIDRVIVVLLVMDGEPDSPPALVPPPTWVLWPLNIFSSSPCTNSEVV